jgi:hypothetical protein
MLHKKWWCNGKDFAFQFGGEGIESLFLQHIYPSLG